MPVAVLHKKIDSLPENYIEKVNEYVEFLLWNLNTNKENNSETSLERKIAILDRIMKKRKPMRPDFNMDNELESALREKYGYIS